MIPALAALLLLQVATPAPDRLTALRLQPSGDRQALVVLLSGPDVTAIVRRDGGRVLVEVGAEPAPELPMPDPLPPIEAVTMEAVPGGATRIDVQVPEQVVFEVHRQGPLVTILFGTSSRPSVAELYGLLFPGGPEEAGGQVVPDDGGAAEQQRGFFVGGVDLEPSATTLYTTGTGNFEAGQEPQEDSYYEFRPRLDTAAQLAAADLSLDYELRVRRGSRFDGTNGRSHVLDAGLQAPLGASMRLNAANYFIKGRPETGEVDPGREFFYGLAPFTRNTTSADLSFDLGALIRAAVGGSRSSLSFEERAAFFPYTSWSAYGALRRELGPALTLDVRYAYGRIDAPGERPVTEARTHSVQGSVEGEIRPLLTGQVLVGYARRHHPVAAPPARDASDVVASIRLRQELTPSTWLELLLGRSQNVSSFESNPFYLAETAQLRLTAPLPMELSFQGSAGYHVNTYPLDAEALDEPRRDRIFGWTAGVARPLSRWGYLRIEYQRNRRRSNVPGFSFTTDGLTVQLGIRPFRPDGGPRP